MNLPTLKIRLFSSCQYYLDKCFYSNFYKIRGIKKDSIEKPGVVDFGAHAGYFTVAALSLGAKRVYSFEPFSENYKILVENISNNGIGDVKPYQIGVYPKDTILTLEVPKFKDSHFDFSQVLPITHKTTGSTENIAVFTLDKILTTIINETVDILKINIGYAEYDILTGSKLEKVLNVCGQTILEKDKLDDFKNLMAAKGFTSCKIAEIDENDGILFFFSKEDINKRFKFE